MVRAQLWAIMALVSLPAAWGRHTIIPRADCKTAKIIPGEGCWAIAERCGTTQSQLERYNGGKGFCNSLQANQVVCCSQGSLPSTGPSPNQDETCTTAQAVSGDGCGTLATKCGITPAEFTKYNSKKGLCSSLAVGQYVCCSKGKLPTTEHPAQPDGTCTTAQVISGDGCGTLAGKCGITASEFTKYNSKRGLCASLAVGQYVCCSKGKLPDMRPKSGPDGKCASYAVKKGDSCAAVAASNGLTVDEIRKFNNGSTWGFTGCTNLAIGANICLSKGKPPMPAPVTNAVCGPQVPNTKIPTDTSRKSLIKLNPCPLNVCCNIWGQCGTTEAFCKVTGDGTPGDVKPGTNGCIANCGTEIVNNDNPPSEFRTIAYFEAWNAERPCLFMDIADVDKSQYTHIHFSFVDLTPSYAVTTAKVQKQFDQFVKVDGIKRIVAFGGWAASTQPSTFNIFRDGVKPGNREVLTSNLAAFVNKHNLDGIDIDWEYPATPDEIAPGIPADDPLNGKHYRDFLALLRKKLPKKSISIAAPASYWYLKGFPINEIAKIVDYIVYMTYDLHGMWDFGSAWSQEGCPKGDCLRSHINITETKNSLAMITKAGVPAHKINVGVTSYGRSFKALQAGCDGPMCKYSSVKGSAPIGSCTGTSGYLANAEINHIMATDKKARWHRDEASLTDILVYNGTEWVAFMNTENKLRRTEMWRKLNFGGTSDWAVDLAQYSPSEKEKKGYSLLVSPIDEGAWKAVACTVPAVETVKMDPRLRWEGVGAPQAWEELKRAWANRGDEWGANDTFSMFASDFFHASEGMQCQQLSEENGCRSHFICKDFENIADTGTAAYFIFNSFINISVWLYNNYQAIQNAGTNIDSLNFASAFGPDDTKDADFVTFTIINALTVGFTMGLAPVFNNMLQNTVKATVRDNVKDSTMALVGVGGTQIKEIIVDLETDKDANSYVEHAINTAAKGYQTTLTELSAAIFEGDATSLDLLDKFLADGKFIMPVDTIDLIDLTEHWETAIYSTLIGNTWEMVGITPVILDTGADCSDDRVGVGEYISAHVATMARGCVDNKVYYLVDPEGRRQTVNEDGSWNEEFWAEPNGLSTIASGDWAGITVQDMIERQVLLSLYTPLVVLDADVWPIISSAVKYTKAHGNRKSKDESVIDPVSKEGSDRLREIASGGNMLKTPGIVDIPVCSEKEASENWYSHHSDKTPRYHSYPCNK